MEFSKGMQVEVCSDEDGLRGAWFEATILRPSTKRHKVYVEYKNLTNVKGSNLLKEFVNQVNLRPVPPREANRSFNSNDEVDAYYNDGWWEGVVIQVLDKEKDNSSKKNRYLVYFRPGKEQLEFGDEDLRIHREWVNAQWVPPMPQGSSEMPQLLNLDLDQLQKTHKNQNKKSRTTPIKAEDRPEDKKADQLQKRKKKQNKPSGMESVEPKKKSSKLAVMEYNEGMQVEVSSDEDGFVGAWFTAKIVKAVGKDKFIVEYQTLRTEDETELLKEEAESFHIRPPPPEIPNVVSFRLLEEVDAMYNDAWWIGVVSKVLKDSKYIVYFRENNEEIEFNHSQLRFHQDWINGNWIRASMALNL